MKIFKGIPGRWRIQPQGWGAMAGGICVAYSLSERSVYWAVFGIALAVMGRWAIWEKEEGEDG